MQQADSLTARRQDEFDREMPMVSEVGEREFMVDGLTPLHDLAERLNVVVEMDEVSTFGGYITYQLGRMPRKGETFRIRELEITATKLDKRRVLSAAVRVVDLKAEAEATSEGGQS